MARFLVFHPKLDIYGGAEKVCHNVIKALVSHGQHVELLTFGFDAERYAKIMDEKLPAEVVVNSLGEKMEISPPFTIYKKHHQFAQLLKKAGRRLEYDFLFSTQSSSPFEPTFLDRAKKNIAYVHFPEIHFEYEHATLKRKAYMWLFKKWIEHGVEKLDLVFCNSNYSKEIIRRFWRSHGIKEPIVVYPPVDLEAFWCDRPLKERQKRVTYVGRFIPMKRHEIMKRLAADLPEYEFVSIGGLMESERAWFNRLSENVTKNYILKPNAARADLIALLQTSRVHVHLMEGEHFGIAPIEALASGCITLVHNSGGTVEFIRDKFRWESYGDLKEKIRKFMDMKDENDGWETTRKEYWKSLSALKPEIFQDAIWAHVKSQI